AAPYGGRALRRAQRGAGAAARGGVGATTRDRARAGAGHARRSAASLGCAPVRMNALPDAERRTRASVAVGTFDGVHLGHRAVMEGAESVLTFDPHPVSVVSPQHTPKLLTRPERKAVLIAGLGEEG